MGYRSNRRIPSSKAYVQEGMTPIWQKVIKQQKRRKNNEIWNLPWQKKDNKIDATHEEQKASTTKI